VSEAGYQNRSQESERKTQHCEGLPGVYSTIWCLCYKTNELKKKKQKERRWACLHRLRKRGSLRGRRGRRSDLRLGKHPLCHPGGTARVLALAVEKRRCLRRCRRLDRAPARHILHLSHLHDYLLPPTLPAASHDYLLPPTTICCLDTIRKSTRLS
jgi:hypothetical protein